MGFDPLVDADRPMCGDAECVFASCAELHQLYPAAPSGVHTIDGDGAGAEPAFRAYCDMAEAGGGWTLLMKLDGSAPTFHGYSELWTNRVAVNADQPDLDRIEAKLPSFWTVPFTELRLGMTDSGGYTRWISVAASAPSLFDALQSSVPIAAGRDTWLSLLPDSRLQAHCNHEGVQGFSRDSLVRIGITANNEDNCDSPDSMLGLGLPVQEYCGLTNTGTVGNFAACMPTSAEDRVISAFGYVLAR